MKPIYQLIVAMTITGCGGPGFYAPCEEPAHCEDVIPEGATAECVEAEGGGFCSWQCSADPDCDGDLDDDWDFICAPFESNPQQYCFPACNEDTDDATAECPEGYGCRSTGGGSENRKICFPS